jgi:DNA adenine methylase
MTAPIATPIVKWAGGKGGLLSQLTPMLPTGIELMRYVEPFVGGGAMFFRLRPERALLCDINRELMDTYRAVRHDAKKVIEVLQELASGHNEQAYYRVRKRYNAAENRSWGGPAGADSTAARRRSDARRCFST